MKLHGWRAEPKGREWRKFKLSHPLIIMGKISHISYSKPQHLTAWLSNHTGRQRSKEVWQKQGIWIGSACQQLMVSSRKCYSGILFLLPGNWAVSVMKFILWQSSVRVLFIFIAKLTATGCPSCPQTSTFTMTLCNYGWFELKHLMDRWDKLTVFELKLTWIDFNHVSYSLWMLLD